MPNHPLAEVFGFPTDNLSATAERYRRNKLCPYHNKVPSCTKDKAKDPLGVCSIYEGEHLAVTCPVRFRQDWLIIEDAANFLFAPGTNWTSLQEVRLNDAEGKSAGNIDFVLVAYDELGRITDFGALHVQAVSTKGNIRQPFAQYMAHREIEVSMVEPASQTKANYAESFREQLLPQLVYKGAMLQAWGKKQAVALQRPLFETLPQLPTVPREEADMVWLIYDLEFLTEQNRHQLVLHHTKYTKFDPAWQKIASPTVISSDRFVAELDVMVEAR